LINENTLRSAGDKKIEVPLSRIALLMAVVLVLSCASIEFTRSANLISSFWPSNAIVLIALLKAPRSLKNYSLIFAAGWIGIFCANLLGGRDALPSGELATADVLEVAAALAALHLLNADADDLTSFRSLFIFVIVGGLAPVVGATLGAATIAQQHAIEFSRIWISWYATDVLGMIVVGPFLMTMTYEQFRSVQLGNRHLEASLVLGLVVIVCTLAVYYRVFVFAVIPVILVAILRFRLIGAATAVLVFAVVSIYFVSKGIGFPILRQASPAERILALQTFLVAIALWSFPVASLLAERDGLLQSLDSANVQLREDNEKKTQMVIDLHRSLLNVEERQRLHLSHDLHDQTGQPLAAALIELGAIEKEAGNLQRDRIGRLRERLDEIMQALHRIAWQLRPPAIDELGLASALSDYVSEWSHKVGIKTDFQCDDLKLDNLSDEIRMTIYRVLGEALTNAAKHARGCTVVSVLINRVDSRLQMIIEDDGCGFDAREASGASASAVNGGLGIAGMRERLMFIGGDLAIESSPGAGTTVFARIPV